MPPSSFIAIMMTKSSSGFSAWLNIVIQTQHNAVAHKLNNLASSCPLVPNTVTGGDNSFPSLATGSNSNSTVSTISDSASCSCGHNDHEEYSPDEWLS